MAIRHTSHAAGLPPRPSSPKTREQVTRSPSYLKGTAGLVLSPARAEETTAGAGAAQLAPPGIACPPSSTTVMKSPPAPVRTGRPTKPKKQASGVPRTPAGGGGGTAGGHGLLPPPAIQREARSSFLKNGSGVDGGGGGSTGGVRMARRPSALRHHSPVQQEQQEDGKFGLFVFGASRNRGDGGGGEAGAPCPETPGTGGPQAPFTPGAEGRPEDFVGGDAGHLSETRTMALPATPTVTRDPRTPGFASTPGICSPPAPCHRGTGFGGGGGGGGRRVGSRLRAGVDVDEGVGVCFAEGGPPPTAGGDDCGGCESRAAGGGGGEVGRGSGTIIISSRSSCCEEAGRCSGTGVDDVGGGGSLGCCRGGSRRRQSRGRSSETSYTEPPTREEQLLDASSAERFSEDLNEAGEAWGGGLQQGIRRRSGRGARRSAEEREREGVSADDPRPLKNKQVVHTFASSGRSPSTASRRGPREHYWLN